MNLGRLVRIATILAVVAACLTGTAVAMISGDAASIEGPAGVITGFSTACFGLTWLSVLTVGWLIARRREREE